MRYSHKLSDAVHILAYVDICHDGDLSSAAIAASVSQSRSGAAADGCTAAGGLLATTGIRDA